jgi:hypothetical protein
MADRSFSVKPERILAVGVGIGVGMGIAIDQERTTIARSVAW